MADTQLASPPTRSTSSAERRYRKRYLGVTIAGEATSPANFFQILRARIPRDISFPFRVVKSRRSAGLVELSAVALPQARRCWNATGIHTYRTFGTLRKGKVWLRGRGGPKPEP